MYIVQISENSDFLPQVTLTDWFLGAFEKFQKRLLASKCLSVYLSDRMEQLDSHWMNFHEMLHLSTFRKSVEKI
jgi:hypothetical protein